MKIDLELLGKMVAASGKLRPEIDFSAEHCENMLARLSKLMHEIFDNPKDYNWFRPRGRFER